MRSRLTRSFRAASDFFVIGSSLEDRARSSSTVGRIFHLYTDACFENSEGGVGGVLFDGHGAMLSFFSEKLGVETVNLLSPGQKQNVIFELEALAVLM